MPSLFNTPWRVEHESILKGKNGKTLAVLRESLAPEVRNLILGADPLRVQAELLMDALRSEHDRLSHHEGDLTAQAACPICELIGHSNDLLDRIELDTPFDAPPAA